MSSAALGGKRVLVVEDEALISMMIEDMLQEMGCVVAGTATDISGAAALADSRSPDCVILDIHLADGDSYPLADRLVRRGIPVVLSTGDYRSDMPRGYDRYPCITKPFTFSDLEAGLHQALQPAA